MNQLPVPVDFLCLFNINLISGSKISYKRKMTLEYSSTNAWCLSSEFHLYVIKTYTSCYCFYILVFDALVVFPSYFTRETLSVTFCLTSCTPFSFEKFSTVKRKQNLSRGHYFLLKKTPFESSPMESKFS